MLFLENANPVHLIVALSAFVGILFLLFGDRVLYVLFDARRRLPKKLSIVEASEETIPFDVRQPLEYLRSRLATLGFSEAGGPVSVPELQGAGYRVVVVPFLHEQDCSYFLMGIEAGLKPRSQLVLHLITPLTRGRRVETTTLGPLDLLVRPAKVDAQVIREADSVEQIWSKHRLALNNHQRGEREKVTKERWFSIASDAYEAWLQSAVRAHRLVLDKSGERYRLKGPPQRAV